MSELMAKYHDKSYDGVVIKLPRYFIDQNNLQSLLDEFKEKLEEKVKFSYFLPDYQSSLKELEGGKADYIEYERKILKERAEKEENRRKKFVNLDIIKINPRFSEYIWEIDIDRYNYFNFDLKLPNGEVVNGLSLKSTGKKELFSKPRINELNEKVFNLITNDDEAFVKLFESNTDLFHISFYKNIKRWLKEGLISAHPKMFYENSYSCLCWRFYKHSAEIWIDSRTYIEIYLMQFCNDSEICNNKDVIVTNEKYLQGKSINLTKDYIYNKDTMSFLKKSTLS